MRKRADAGFTVRNKIRPQGELERQTVLGTTVMLPSSPCADSENNLNGNVSAVDCAGDGSGNLCRPPARPAEVTRAGRQPHQRWGQDGAPAEECVDTPHQSLRQ